jgi:hypothetical protein
MGAAEFMVRACDPQSLTVHDVMEDSVLFTIGPDTTRLRIADLLAEHHSATCRSWMISVSCLGWCPEFDLLHAMEQRRDLQMINASEIMTRAVVTVPGLPADHGSDP